eukprot:4069699-Amphidinium_carterae.1
MRPDLHKALNVSFYGDTWKSPCMDRAILGPLYVHNIHSPLDRFLFTSAALSGTKDGALRALAA